MENKDLGTTSIGLKANVAAALCYVLGWVSGLVFFLIEKNNKFVRFHALQAMVVFGAFTVIYLALPVVPGLGAVAMPILFIIELVLWVVLMVKAFQGEKWKLPAVGDIAEKHA